VICLKRQEAIELLKEIVAACERVDYTNITLKPPSDEAAEKSVGYELHIKDHFNEEDWKCMNDITQKRGLSMKKRVNQVVIYKPR
jgi:hypothetical protein